MKLTKDQLAPIFGTNQRPTKRVTKEELKDAGVAFATYGIGVGETVEFPENADENMFSQPTVVGGNNTQILAPCMRSRGGREPKASWFAMGSLVRQDAHREYTCDFTRDMAEKYSNHEQRIEVLAGKTIKGTEPLEIDVVKFDTATRKPVRTPDGATVFEKGRATKIEYV